MGFSRRRTKNRAVLFFFSKKRKKQQNSRTAEQQLFFQEWFVSEEPLRKEPKKGSSFIFFFSFLLFQKQWFVSDRNEPQEPLFSVFCCSFFFSFVSERTAVLFVEKSGSSFLWIRTHGFLWFVPRKRLFSGALNEEARSFLLEEGLFFGARVSESICFLLWFFLFKRWCVSEEWFFLFKKRRAVVSLGQELILSRRRCVSEQAEPQEPLPKKKGQNSLVARTTESYSVCRGFNSLFCHRKYNFE